MSELKLDVRDEQADNPADVAFQKRAARAKEPDIDALAVGQKWEAFEPYYRHCRVLQKSDTSVIVESSAPIIPGAWKELWAIRECEIQDPMTKNWITSIHLIVVRDTRPAWQKEASPLAAKIDEKTGKLHRPETAIVKVVRLEDDDAVQNQIGGQGQIQGSKQADGPSNEQEVKEQGGGEKALGGPVRKRRGRPPKHKASG